MVDKIKKLFQRTTSVQGSYSVGLMVLAICAAVLVNMIAGQLPEKVKSIDISDKKIYEITDTSREMLKDLDQKIQFTVYAEKSSTDERIRTFLNKYTGLTDKISVEWVDPVLHPTELTENDVSENTILVECEDTGKTTTVSFSDMIVSDEYSYYMTGQATESEFDGEGQLTSAVNYVTSDVEKKIYYTTGHGENTFSSSVSELLGKNNMTEEEINLIMKNEIPEDCDLLVMYGLASDITEDEKNLILSYLSEGGNVMILPGDADEETTNLDALLAEYGMEMEDGYIADMQRSYQGNYYYIFPELTLTDSLSKGMSTNMVLLVNAHGMHVTDPARDTITVESFMTTSSDAYAVTQDSQKQGTFTLGATATESVGADEADTEETDGADTEGEADSTDDADTAEEADGADTEAKESHLTVITASSIIDSEITDTFTGLENLALFVNAVSDNFDDVQNVAIEPKSLEVTYNTMQHAGLLSIVIIFIIPLAIVIFGFVRWWKRRKA